MNHAPESDAGTTRRLRSLFFNRYLFLVGLCFYFAVVWYLGWREVGGELLDARLQWIAATAGIIFFGNWARALKWRLALGPGHNAAGIFFLSKVSAEWSPGRLGEFSPMVLRKHRTPKIGAWILTDRLLEIVVTLTLGFVGLAFIQILSPVVYFSFLAIAVIGFAALVYFFTRRRWFLALAERSRHDSWSYKINRLLAAMSTEIVSFRRRLPMAMAITVVVKCTDLWAVCLLFRGFGYTPGFALVATAKCALAIVSFIPITPLATGLPHVTQAGLMNYVAAIPYDGLVAAIGVEVVIVSVALWTSGGIAAIWERTRSVQTPS